VSTSTYKGFFGAEYGVKSTIKMYVNTLILSCFVWLIAAGICYFKFLPGKTVSFPIPSKKGIVELMLGRDAEYSRLLDRWNQSVMKRAKKSFRKTVWAPPIAFILLIFLFHFVAGKQGKGKQIRGSELVTPRRLNRLLRKEGEGDLQIGQIKLPKKLETEHCLCVGRPGAGKTTFLYGIIQRLRERNERAIIYDFKGDYIEKFYDPKKDQLFNPFDKRTINWSIFNEIDSGGSHKLSINAIANSLIPDEPRISKYWAKASRGLLAGTLLYLCKRNKRTNKALWDMCCEGPKDIEKKFREPDVKELCQAYIRDLEGGDQSIRKGDLMASFSSQIAPFEYLVDSSGDFSFKSWVENGKGFLFIANKPSQSETLKPLVSLAIDIMLTAGIDLTDDINRRLFLLIDEFGTLQKLPTFVNFLTNSRSKGGSVWCGLQDFGAIKETYGDNIRETFFNSFGALYCMKVDAVETSSYIAKGIGQREVLKQRPTMQVSDDHVGHGSLSENKIEDLILASEITKLNKLEGYLRISNYAVTKTKVKRREIPNKAKAFEPREIEIKTKNKIKPNQVDFNNSEDV